MKTIIHVFDVKDSPQKVFEAIHSENGLSGWWTTRVRADTTTGGKIHFTFLEGFNPVMELKSLESPHLIKWTCVDGHEEWKDNQFSFKMTENEAGTLVTFTQHYARELSDEVYGRYNFNWGYYLDSLRAFVETGEGKPYQA